MNSTSQIYFFHFSISLWFLEKKKLYIWRNKFKGRFKLKVFLGARVNLKFIKSSSKLIPKPKNAFNPKLSLNYFKTIPKFTFIHNTFFEFILIFKNAFNLKYPKQLLNYLSIYFLINIFLWNHKEIEKCGK